MTFGAKQVEDERMIFDYNVIHGSTLYASGKLKGGAAMTANEIANAFDMMPAQLQQVQTAFAAEQVPTADFGQSMYRAGDSGIKGLSGEAR